MAYIFSADDVRRTVTMQELAEAPDDGSYIIALDYGTSSEGKAYWI